MTESRATGHCLCGAIGFEAEGVPLAVSLCHCESCRRHSGGVAVPFATFRKDAVRWQGADRQRYRSSPPVVRSFCGRCGSPLFYESAEGGAGILRQLVNDPAAIANVARCSIDLCHADPDTGDDHPDDHCAVACYECLLSYSNQRDHQLLDRRRAIPFLRELADATVVELPDDQVAVDPTPQDAAEHLDDQAESELERRFTQWLREQNLRIPQRGTRLDIGGRSTTPDFVFPDANLVIYVDGPPHDYPDRQQRDAELTSALRDKIGRAHV